MTNPYGDVELTPEGMRALAHPVRLRILMCLRTEPSTATRLSEHVGASPSVTSWHLRHLAHHGLVSDAPGLGTGRERYWRAAKGFRFAATDPSTRAAANALQQALDRETGDVVGAWRRHVEPLIEQPWAGLAGSSDTTLTITADELRAVNEAIEALLAPLLTRSEVPESARSVRILRHMLPAADEPTVRDVS